MSAPWQGYLNQQTDDKRPEMIHDPEDSPAAARVVSDVVIPADASTQQQESPRRPFPTSAASTSSQIKRREPQVSMSSKHSHDSIEMTSITTHKQTDSEMEDTNRGNSEDNLPRWKKAEMRNKRFNELLTTSQYKCYETLKKYDDEMIKGWNAEIDILLFFAGLFSAVVTTFSVQSYPALNPPSPDPSAVILAQISDQLRSLQIGGQSITSTVPQAQATNSSAPAPLIVINILWFTSLIFSLVSASIGILLKQWLREYETVRKDDIEDKLRLWKLRHDGLVRWRVKELVMLLPLLLQIALIMFLIGLVELAWMLNPIVAAFVTAFVSVALAFTAITTVLPAVVLACPYKSPQARLFFNLWQWSNSSFRAGSRVFHNILSSFSRHTQEITNSSPYARLHDWSQWEDSYIKDSWFILDAHILRAVKVACAGTTSRKLYATIGPIAVNALGMNWRKFDRAPSGQCPSGESAKSLDEHLDIAEEYCDYSHDSLISVEKRFLSCLASLLKWDPFQKRSWSMIRRHGLRFDVHVYSWADLAPVIQFVKKQINDISTVSPDLEYIMGARAVIRLSTQMDDLWFKRDSRDTLTRFLDFLSPQIRDISKFAAGKETRRNGTIWFLRDLFEEILALAEKHNSAVTADFVCACEEGVKDLEKIPNLWYRREGIKEGIKETLKAIRKLVDDQKATSDRVSNDSFRGGSELSSFATATVIHSMAPSITHDFGRGHCMHSTSLAVRD